MLPVFGTGADNLGHLFVLVGSKLTQGGLDPLDLSS